MKSSKLSINREPAAKGENIDLDREILGDRQHFLLGKRGA
jgi:hypothetical protein